MFDMKYIKSDVKHQPFEGISFSCQGEHRS